MATFVEPVGGGLVTIRDPAFLSEGELSDLHNGVYRAQSMSLYRATGRTSFGTVSAANSDVVGLRSVQFDNGNYYLVALCSDTLLTAAVGDTGTFGTLTGVVSGGLTLERVHYNNRFMMFTGATADRTTEATASNRVIYQSATAVATQLQIRQHGMAPVTAAPDVTSTSGTFSQGITGYYEYWTTEVAKFQQDNAEVVMESTFSSINKPTTIFVSATGMVPVISMPGIQNPGFTTHWRIYRSTKKDVQSDQRFPIGFMISELVATGTSAALTAQDTLTVTTTSSLGANVDTVGTLAGFTTASAMFVADTNYASGALTLLGHTKQNIYGFNFGGFTGNVKGIAVEVRAYVSVGAAPIPVTVTIGKRDTNTGYFTKSLPIVNIFRTASKSFLVTGTANPGAVYTVGSSADIWFQANNDLARPLTPSDFDGNFMVVLESSNFATRTIGVDYVKVYVYYGGSIDSVTPFPSVVYTFGDVTAQVGKNHPPPPADTADMYQDSLVCNDKNSPSFVRWSWPGDPEIFPPLYYIDFETEHNDRVRMVKVVNDRCIVGLDHSMWRINYLPSERDASFDRGKAIQRLSNRFGCVSPMCAVVFSPNGANEKLAFVSHKGIHQTDGYSFQDVTDLDWRGVINPTATGGPIALIDNPEEQELIFYYQNSALGTESVMALHLNYSPLHLDEAGNPKVSGPVHVRNFDSGTSTSAAVKSAWSLPRTDGRTSIYTGYGGASAAGGGKVYIDSGENIPASDPTMSWTTRRLYLAGPGKEWRANGVFAYFDSITSGQSITATPLSVFTNNEVGEVSGDATTRAVASAKQYYFPMNQGGEGIRLQWAQAAGTQFGLAVGQQIIDGQDFGIEDSGR